MSRRPSSSVPGALRGFGGQFLLLALLVTATTVVVPGERTEASTATQYPAVVLADSPAGWWRLGETSGAAAADSAAANMGTYRNGVLIGRASLLPADTTSHAATFDGVNDDVRVASSSSLSPTAAVSVEAWLRADTLPVSGAFASVVTKRESYSLQFNGPRLEFTIMKSGVRRRLDAPAGAVAVGRAYHVVGTYGGGVQRLYIDGVQVASASLSCAITANTNDLTIARWGGTKERFDGTIDEVAIYRTVLSASRVAAHNGAGRTTVGSSPAPSPTPIPAASPPPVPTASPTPVPAASPPPVPPPTATSLPSLRSSPTPAPTASASPLSAGLALHFMWQTLDATNADLDLMKACGMTYVRFDVSWRNSEPSKGTYRYLDKLDQVIAAVRAHGMALTMTVIETPGWANNNAGTFAPPTNVADYASFVGMLAGRYASRTGMVWEVWNEENDPHFWTTGPDAAQYTSMLTGAYRAIKASDPDATVLVGGILFNNTAFLDGIYLAGGGDSFDGVAIHPYTINRAPGDTSSPYYSFASSVPQFQADLGNHGQATKPIWVTEFGWSTANVPDATRATWFTDAVTIARGWTNVRGLGAYTLHQSQFAEYGLLTTAGTATLSWTAYVAAQ
jgi:hypothetical protein